MTPGQDIEVLPAQTPAVAPEKVGTPALSAEQVRARVNLIQQVMKGVMKNGIHYGSIPGTGQTKTLLKPGAETLAVAFQLAVNPVVEDLSTADNVHYRVTCRANSQVSGDFLGSGIGEASSDEEKYRWRRVVCDAEFDEAPEDRRREVWKRGQPNYQIKQVRTVPADVANTILKMAKKRAQVDMTLTVTGASDIFAQDIEDLPEFLRTAIAEGENDATSPVRARTLKKVLDLATKKGVSQKQLSENLTLKAYEGALVDTPEVLAEWLIEGLESLPDAKAQGKSTKSTKKAAVAQQEPIPAPSATVEADPTREGVEERTEDEVQELDRALEADPEPKPSLNAMVTPAIIETIEKLCADNSVPPEAFAAMLQMKTGKKALSELTFDEGVVFFDFLKTVVGH